MGKLSNIFKNIGHGITGKGRTGYFKATQKWNRSHSKRGGYAGGYGAITFGNIINAHSNAEEIVETFGLDEEENSYGCDAYERAYSEQYDIAEQIYQEWVDYYLGIIETLTSQMNACIEEAEMLEQTAQELQEEAESLRDDAELSDNPEEAMELIEEAEALEAEAQELLEEAEALRAEAMELQGEIDANYSEIDMLTIEQFIDNDVVTQNSFEYACEFAEKWINGEEWIPIDVLNWAYYDVSDHNG